MSAPSALLVGLAGDSCRAADVLMPRRILLISANLPACWWISDEAYFDRLYAERAVAVDSWNRSVTAW